MSRGQLIYFCPTLTGICFGVNVSRARNDDYFCAAESHDGRPQCNYINYRRAKTPAGGHVLGVGGPDRLATLLRGKHRSLRFVSPADDIFLDRSFRSLVA